MKKIKILHLQLLPLLSGVQNMMIQLLKGLNQANYDIYVVSCEGGPLVNEVLKNNWTHIPLKNMHREISLKDFKATIELYRILNDIKPDIIHTHSSKTGFIGRIVGRIAGVKLVIHTLHGFSFHPYQSFIVRTFYQILESFAAIFADYNVFVNQFEREIALHKLGFNSKKALTIYNGIKPYKVIKSYEGISDYSEKPFRLVSVLRFSSQKNIVATIEQAINIVKENKNIYFTFYGYGELFDVCKNLIIANNVTENIKLPGWITAIRKHLLDYDVFLLNSLWEGLPISILEAMSVGLPVIASSIKGNNELVDDSNGWLIDPKDNTALNKVIKKIIKNPLDLQQKGEQSIKKVTYVFNEEFFISKYAELYNKIEKSD